MSCQYQFGGHFCLFDVHIGRDFDLENLLMFVVVTGCAFWCVGGIWILCVCEGILYGLLTLVIDTPSITEWQDAL